MRRSARLFARFAGSENGAVCQRFQNALRESDRIRCRNRRNYQKLPKTAETGFILQTGLAPGFINVLAMSLYNQFVEKFENEKVEQNRDEGRRAFDARARAAFLRFYMVADRCCNRICEKRASFQKLQEQLSFRHFPNAKKSLSTALFMKPI